MTTITNNGYPSPVHTTCTMQPSVGHVARCCKQHNCFQREEGAFASVLQRPQGLLHHYPEVNLLRETTLEFMLLGPEMVEMETTRASCRTSGASASHRNGGRGHLESSGQVPRAQFRRTLSSCQSHVLPCRCTKAPAAALWVLEGSGTAQGFIRLGPGRSGQGFPQRFPLSQSPPHSAFLGLPGSTPRKIGCPPKTPTRPPPPSFTSFAFS